MSAFVILALVSAAGAALLFVVLAVFLTKIAVTLESIGGERPAYGSPASFLSKIRLGVRAIEVQVGALGPGVTRLNSGLGAVRDGLRGIDANLGATIAAVSRQEGR